MTAAPPTPTTLSDATYAAVLQRHGFAAPTTITPVTPYAVLADDAVVIHHAAPPEDVLPRIALIERRLHAAGIPVPEVLAFDTAQESVAADILLERALPGGVVARDIWPALQRAEQEALSEALGRVIATIHTLAWPGYGTINGALPYMGLYGRWVDALFARITTVARELQASMVLPLRLVDGALIALNDGDSLIETASLPVLAHCDLSWDNVLLRPTGTTWEIGAITGWSGALVADEAWEFAELWLYRNRPYPDPDGFISGYRSVRKPQADRRPRRNLYRLLIHLEGALTAYRGGDLYHYARHEAALLRLLRK